MHGILRTIALWAISIVVIVFLVQNLASAEVAFLTWSVSAPRAIVFALLFALGLAFGYLLRALRRPSAVRPAAP